MEDLNKTILAILATSTIGIVGMTSFSYGYDLEFRTDNCRAIYDLGQEKLSIAEELGDMARHEAGYIASGLYSYARDAKFDFNTIKTAFNFCQKGQPYTLIESTLDTFDRVEIEKAKLREGK